MTTTHTASEGHNTPRDTFLYLLSLITLVVSAVSFGMLVYRFIDIAFPDALRQAYYPDSNLTLIRSALAALVVVFPVFIWISVFLHRDVAAHPEKRHLKVRRWLMYLTVFAAALVVIGDLIALIFNFLQGDLTAAFLLKVLAILFIAGSSFWYYLAELQDRQYPREAFRWAIIGVVAAAVVYGFVTVGSPQHQRLIRFDEQKVSNLQMIQSYLVYNYWQQKGSLPATLDQLNDPISNFQVPADPQSGAAYEYRTAGVRSFELCAIFNEAGQYSTGLPAGDENNWQHGAGRVCFQRTIDPALYPVKSPAL